VAAWDRGLSALIAWMGVFGRSAAVKGGFAAA
jgi:hypothetical protein